MFIPDSLSKLAKRATETVAEYAPLNGNLNSSEVFSLARLKGFFQMFSRCFLN
jgi:hypothetical protein